ncbi:MAG: membrane protein insertase YidC [Woeseiaceae bacterium]
MDNQRLFIWAIFGVLAWMTYQAWVEMYAPPPAEMPTANNAQVEQPEAGLPNLDDAVPMAAGPEAPAGEVPSLQPQAPTSVATDAPTISVVTDVLQMEISAAGGTLQGAVLTGYPVAKDRPDEKVSLLSANANDLAVIQSGVLSRGGVADANHQTIFTAASKNFDMGSSDELVVPLSWTNEAGVTFTKTYRFSRGSYIIHLEQSVSNNGNSVWQGTEYVQLDRRLGEWERSMFDVDSYSFDGPIAYDGEKAEKLQRDDLLDDGAYTYKSSSGWFGAIQHHFVAAVVPEAGVEQSFEVSLANASDQTALSRAIGTIVSVPPGQSHTFNTTLFVGPKLQSQLEQIDERLKLTVDYGWLTLLSNPLFWLLSAAFGIFGNWGVAIIAVTVLIKLVFYKLTESSGRSMAKMRNLQPRIKAMQERYKDDKQAQSQAMMELYKTEKVNPAAGCLPILIQMPFFLAFYWVLLESVEMRQAPFMLWITDLSVRDPFFILPLIMGAAMFFQQKLNPQVGDPIQIKVMQIMPIIFTAFFAFFPAGLVLYWVTNTLLSIAQQWKINKVVEKESKQKKSGKRPKKA